MKTTYSVIATLLLPLVVQAQSYRLTGYEIWDSSYYSGEYYAFEKMQAYFSGGNPGNYEDFIDEYGYSIDNFYWRVPKIDIRYKADSVVFSKFEFNYHDPEPRLDMYYRHINLMNPFGDIESRREEKARVDETVELMSKNDYLFDNCTGTLNGIKLLSKEDGEYEQEAVVTCEWENGLLTKAHILNDYDYDETWAPEEIYYWHIDHTISYYYLPDGKLSDIVVMDNDDGDLYSSTSYDYNDDGTLASMFYESGPNVDEDRLILYEYDAEGRLMEMNTYDEFFTPFPDAHDKNIYSYDVEGNLIQDLWLVFSGGEFRNSYRRDYTYDEHQLRTTEMHYNWEDTVWQWSTTKTNHYELYDPGDTLNAIDVANDLLQVYPNPVSCCAAVIFQASADGTADIVLYDATGREVFKTMMEVMSGKNYITLPLDELKLRNAIYIVAVTENGNRHSTELIKY